MGTHHLWHLFSAIRWPVHCLSIFHGSPRWGDHSHVVLQAIWWALASSIQWRLGLFYLLGILPTTPVVLLVLFTAPVASLCLTVHTVRWTHGRQKCKRGGRNRVGGAKGTADALLLSRLGQQPQQQPRHNHTQPSGLCQGELIYTYRPKVAPGQASASRRAYAVSAISALSCYITVQSHCLQIMGPEGIVRSWGERASGEPLVEFPTAAMGIDLKSSHLSLSHTHTHTHTLYEVMDVIN